ncbi:MAG: hypothetical protein WDO19_27475 [Bacteroidota bacterium]
MFICWAALTNEIISSISLSISGTNNSNYNIYGIAEAMLYMWLFKGWGHFSNKRRSYVFTISLLCIMWVTDNFILKHFWDTDYLYMVIYSFTLVFLAINEINLIVMNHRGGLLRDSRFLICMGIVIFFTYYVIIAIFNLLELNFSVIFYSNIYMVLQAVNILINLVYALAMIWAPRRQRFILQF